MATHANEIPTEVIVEEVLLACDACDLPEHIATNVAEEFKAWLQQELGGNVLVMVEAAE